MFIRSDALPIIPNDAAHDELMDQKKEAHCAQTTTVNAQQ